MIQNNDDELTLQDIRRAAKAAADVAFNKYKHLLCEPRHKKK